MIQKSVNRQTSKQDITIQRQVHHHQTLDKNTMI
uniref:Uncharacterized protein n=1 Tax=Cucumis melo TaxID=3656 RepID=A0A9I9EAP7_CUCME